jgi:hypothetical protein
MKKGESFDKIQVWEVRANGLPRLLIEAANKANAESIYRERFKIWKKDLVFVEMKCQHQPSESERPLTK